MRVVLEKFPLFNKERVFGRKYRSSFEIIAAILEAAVEGGTRFVIANRLNTSYVLLQRYLDHLVRMGFVDVGADGGQVLFKTSRKGLEFLRLYYALLGMLLEDVKTRAHVDLFMDVLANKRGRS